MEGSGAVAAPGAQPGPSGPVAPEPASPEPDLLRRGSEPAFEEDESLSTSFFKMMLALALVVGLTYLVLNVGLRRLMGLAGVKTGSGSLVGVVERVTLEPKKSLYVVRVPNGYLLLGATEAGLVALRDLDPEQVEKVLAAKGAGAPPPLLQKLLTRRNKEP